MQYETPQPAEGINASRENPLKEFFILALGALVLTLLLVFLVSISAGWIASKLPFRHEVKVADLFFNSNDWSLQESESLTALASELSQLMDLPADLSVQVHYSAEDTVNAFAFLGGHIVIYQGLIDQLKSENALAMVVAHEIAHIKHRDPAKSLSRGVALSLVFSFLFGSTDGTVAGLTELTSTAGLLSFSRRQETAADELALAAVVKKYGHTNGAMELFEAFRALEENQLDAAYWQVLRTHPASISRMEHLSELAKVHAYPQTGELTALNVN